MQGCRDEQVALDPRETPTIYKMPGTVPAKTWILSIGSMSGSSSPPDVQRGHQGRDIYPKQKEQRATQQEAASRRPPSDSGLAARV